MQHIEQRRSSRYGKGEQRVIRTDTNETVRKLRSLTERARLYGRAEGSLVPVEALVCLLYTSPSPRDGLLSRMPSSA